MTGRPRHPFVKVRVPREELELAQGGFLALSGVLRSERETLLSAYASMRVDETLEQGEWCAFVLELRAP